MRGSWSFRIRDLPTLKIDCLPSTYFLLSADLLRFIEMNSFVVSRVVNIFTQANNFPRSQHRNSVRLTVDLWRRGVVTKSCLTKHSMNPLEKPRKPLNSDFLKGRFSELVDPLGSRARPRQIERFAVRDLTRLNGRKVVVCSAVQCFSRTATMAKKVLSCFLMA
jgi:hypothetical protein